LTLEITLYSDVTDQRYRRNFLASTAATMPRHLTPSFAQHTDTVPPR
jgi:hypothetical protein